jgi:hypothetical protein
MLPVKRPDTIKEAFLSYNRTVGGGAGGLMRIAAPADYTSEIKQPYKDRGVCGIISRIRPIFAYITG